MTNNSSNSRHDPISTSMKQQQQQQQQQTQTAIVYTAESNYRTYKTSESYADEDADLFQTNLCQVDRISMNLDSNQEFVPFESVKRFLIDDVGGTGYQVEDEVPDFQDLSSDIEQQFLELSSLDDAVFIDGWEEHLKEENWRRLRGKRHISKDLFPLYFVLDFYTLSLS